MQRINDRSRTRASAQRKARGRSVALPLLLPSDHTSAPRARHASLDEMPLNFARPLDQGMLLTTTTSDAVGEAAGANASSNLPSSPTARPPADPPALGFHSLNFESGRTSPPGMLLDFGTSDSSANDQLDFATSYSSSCAASTSLQRPSAPCAAAPPPAEGAAAASAAAAAAAAVVGAATASSVGESEIEVISSPAVLRETQEVTTNATAQAECMAFLKLHTTSACGTQGGASNDNKLHRNDVPIAHSIAEHLMASSQLGDHSLASPSLAELVTQPSSAPDRLQRLTSRAHPQQPPSQLQPAKTPPRHLTVRAQIPKRSPAAARPPPLPANSAADVAKPLAFDCSAAPKLADATCSNDDAPNSDATRAPVSAAIAPAVSPEPAPAFACAPAPSAPRAAVLAPAPAVGAGLGAGGLPFGLPGLPLRPPASLMGGGTAAKRDSSQTPLGGFAPPQARTTLPHSQTTTDQPSSLGLPHQALSADPQLRRVSTLVPPSNGSEAGGAGYGGAGCGAGGLGGSCMPPSELRGVLGSIAPLPRLPSPQMTSALHLQTGGQLLPPRTIHHPHTNPRAAYAYPRANTILPPGSTPPPAPPPLSHAAAHVVAPSSSTGHCDIVGEGSVRRTEEACRDERADRNANNSNAPAAAHFAVNGGCGSTGGGCVSSPSPSEVQRKERVRQETREQVPALTKMKQSLNAYQVSFARMASDALLSGWSPELEYKLQLLCDEVESLQQREEELRRMEEQLHRAATDAAKANASRTDDDNHMPYDRAAPNLNCHQTADSPIERATASITAAPQPQHAPEQHQPAPAPPEEPQAVAEMIIDPEMATTAEISTLGDSSSRLSSRSSSPMLDELLNDTARELVIQSDSGQGLRAASPSDSVPPSPLCAGAATASLMDADGDAEIDIGCYVGRSVGRAGGNLSNEPQSSVAMMMDLSGLDHTSAIDDSSSLAAQR